MEVLRRRAMALGQPATPAGGLGPRGRGIRGKGLAPRPHGGAGTCDPRWVERNGIESKHTKTGGSKNSPTQIAEILLAKYFFLLVFVGTKRWEKSSPSLKPALYE